MYFVAGKRTAWGMACLGEAWWNVREMLRVEISLPWGPLTTFWWDLQCILDFFVLLILLDYYYHYYHYYYYYYYNKCYNRFACSATCRNYVLQGAAATVSLLAFLPSKWRHSNVSACPPTHTASYSEDRNFTISTVWQTADGSTYLQVATTAVTGTFPFSEQLRARLCKECQLHLFFPHIFPNAEAGES